MNIRRYFGGLACRMKERSANVPLDDACPHGAVTRSGNTAAAAKRFLLLSPVFTVASCTGGTQLSFLNPQGPVAATQRTHFLEMVALLTVFVALPIFVLIPWFAWRFRYGALTARYTPKWAFSRTLEIAAWSGPAVIVAFLAMLVWRSTHTLDPYKPLASNKPPLHVLVVGYDWKWLFIFPEQGVASIGVLPLPAGRPVAMELTSATVMQSLQIPALGGQIYAMGGMVTQLHFQADRPGRFMGENTMYSGDGFHQQKFTVVAMKPDMFDHWVEHAQAHGIPLDTDALNLISRRTTYTQLNAELGRRQGHLGGIYFNRATAAVFSSAVMATMSGGGNDQQNVCHPATTPLAPLVRAATSFSAEHKP